LKAIKLQGDPRIRWFSDIGCVQWQDDQAEVFVGGTLVGRFDRGDLGARNVILVGLASGTKVHLGKLALAFRMAFETLRLVRRQYEAEGLEAVLRRTRGKRKGRLSSKQLKAIEAAFDQGKSVRQVEAEVGRRYKVHKSTIGKLRSGWAKKAAEKAALEETPENAVEGTAQQTLALAENGAEQVVEGTESEATVSSEPELADSSEPEVDVVETAPEARTPEDPIDQMPEALQEILGINSEVTLEATEKTEGSGARSEQQEAPQSASIPGSADEDKGAKEQIPTMAPRGGRFVQHVGAWLMIAMVARLGLYEKAEALRPKKIVKDTLRMALDAAVAALAIGQKCIEGVRRLATPTGAVLLGAARSPAATWVRRLFGRFAGGSRSAWLQVRMMASYLRAAHREKGRPAVFYLDNHTRPYSGKERIRKAWRMQDKRAVPGSTDYYLHDREGRTLMRFPSPENDGLPHFLSPAAQLLRIALGDKQRVLLAFDRAGAYPEQMVELRDESYEFATYERRPYPLLKPGVFKKKVLIDGERYGLYERRTNLGSGRGRVRRISVMTPEGQQINILAISVLKPKELLQVMFDRWGCQENGLKHGVERWGINKLDGNTTEKCDPDEVIPNPARRRLDHALRIARAREGQARRELSRLAKGNPKRAYWDSELRESLEQQADLEAQRPSVPTHAPLGETELAGELVRHTTEYKMLIDTIRVACTNAESELAVKLVKHLPKPAEAKRVLQNVFTSPGHVRVGERTITVELMPAVTRSEYLALQALFASLDERQLTLPGDPRARALRFRLQT
jgi:hypothetical protein